MNIEQELLKILNGYQPGCVLIAASELNVFDELTQPVPADIVADRLKASLKGVERLLNALAALGIVVKEQGQYHLPEDWQPYLCSHGGHSMREWIRLSKDLIQPWLNLSGFVESGSNVSSIMEMLGTDPKKMRDFTNAMHDKGLKATHMLAKEIPLEGYRNMLDVGGGPGTYSLEWCQRNPELKATILDIPPVLEVAKGYIENYGLQDRVDTLPGDFIQDELPKGYDLILLANILHMYDANQAAKVVGKAVDALEANGRIVLHGFCTDEGDTSPINDTLFSINIGLLTPGGRAHPVKEMTAWLEQAGITDIHHFRINAIPTGVITGVKAG